MEIRKIVILSRESIKYNTPKSYACFYYFSAQQHFWEIPTSYVMILKYTRD